MISTLKIKGLKEIVNMHLGHFLNSLDPANIFGVCEKVLDYLLGTGLRELEISGRSYYFFGPSILLNFDHLGSLGEISKLVRGRSASNRQSSARTRRASSEAAIC